MTRLSPSLPLIRRSSCSGGLVRRARIIILIPLVMTGDRGWGVRCGALGVGSWEAALGGSFRDIALKA